MQVLQGFDYVYQEVQKFSLGVYCASSINEEINTPYHSHDKAQLVFTVKGTLHLDTTGEHYFLPMEHFMWIPKNVRHKMWTNNSSFRMFSIYFDDVDAEHPFFNATGVYKVNNLLQEMIGLARNWEGFIDSKDVSRYKFLQGLKAILPQMATAGQLPLLGFVRLNHPRLVEVTNYIKLNIEKKHDLNTTAQKFGLSARSLSRLFNNEGTSFIEYIQALRVIRSMELLAEKNINVNMVAIRVGYESNTAFSNIFLRFTGLRPIDYLQNQQYKKPLT